MTVKEWLKPNQIRKFYKFLDYLPDKLVLHLQYYASVGRRLNLNNPRRFTEKLQWYKLNYRNPLMTICADKYRVREYVEKKGYERYLPKLYGVYDRFEEIDFNKLPNSFAIKANNGSGTNIFIKDKSDMDLNEIESTIEGWKKVNTLSIGREWVYKDIEQKILIEELLVPSDDFQILNGLNDYKIMCFNGEPKVIWVDVNRANNHCRSFFDLNWKQLLVESDMPVFSGKIEKPEEIENMIQIAKKISKDFPFVRADFYFINKKIYIGELTFYPWSGCVQFKPDSFDYELGELFNLPNLSKNISGDDI